jgi:hypothetical protein
MTKRKTNGAKRTPAFVARAERAFARVAQKVADQGCLPLSFLTKSHKPEK